MSNPTSTQMPASEAARIAATHPTGGKYRRDGDAVVGPSGVVGRHADSASTEGLLLDACSAAELLSQHSESWSPEQILVHPEIARLAYGEATRAPEPKAGRRRRRHRAAASSFVPLQQAADVLAEAHTRISFVEA